MNIAVFCSFVWIEDYRWSWRWPWTIVVPLQLSGCHFEKTELLLATSATTDNCQVLRQLAATALVERRLGGSL